MNSSQKLLLIIAVVSFGALWLVKQAPHVDANSIVNTSPGGADTNRVGGDGDASLPKTRQRVEAAPPVADPELISDKEVVDGLELEPTANFENGILSVSGVPFDDVPVETWEFEKLRDLNRSIRDIQIELKNLFLNNNPTEHLFVSNEDFMTYRMWHGGVILHAQTRVVEDENGEEVTEHGYVKVPAELAPDEYILSDAVKRLYQSPAYSEYLIDQGETYQAEVMAKHPDAELDVTDDLTHWIFLNPGGTVVGWMSYSRFGDT